MADLPKTYDPRLCDLKWSRIWEERKSFAVNFESNKSPYCIVMPPPNITGSLHMGHALVSTIQDALIRWHRMKGYEVLWVPGVDHASIATESVVAAQQFQKEGKHKKEYTRAEFLDHVWKWKEKSELRIIEQLKSMGCSCAWDYYSFTMSDAHNKAVNTAFAKLYKDGLIYQDYNYLIHWDPVTQTALSDDEVEYEQRESFLYYIAYSLENTTDVIIVATTRPETILGDTAIAVSLKDPRYRDKIGKKAIVPFVDRVIPIIADQSVDADFGTGALKITPAHDFQDHQIGLAHGLPMINILTPEGKINEVGGVFQGLTVLEARQQVIAALENKGQLIKVEPHVHRVGVSYRSKAVIEPYLSKQWFIRMKEFRIKLREIVEREEVKLIPNHWKQTYFHWIDNLRDWCISRQLWWGHRIPIWYHKDNPQRFVCQIGVELPLEVRAAPQEWYQDPDVLDTWFSSALWPFATLGWPEKTPQLEKFYPNAALVTGHDILFFWVARMILMGEYMTGQPPFKEVFLHGLIYGKSYWRTSKERGVTYVSDKERLEYDLGKPIPSDVFSKWEKMSKTKGNVIDPLEMIDMYGTDAVRMALCASATHARQIDLDRRRFEEFKNFVNKLWNGARFVLLNLNGKEGLTFEELREGLDESLLLLEDRWILSMLNRVIEEVNLAFENYTFDIVATLSYQFFWDKFCSYYLELSKPILFGKTHTFPHKKNKQKLLAIILSISIRLLHPVIPFITEELFELLQKKFTGNISSKNSVIDPYTQETLTALQSSTCSTSYYPQVIKKEDISTEIEETFGLMEEIVYTIRRLRGEMNVSQGLLTDIYLIVKEEKVWQQLQENKNIIFNLVKTSKLEIVREFDTLPSTSSAMCRMIKIVVQLPAELLVQEKQRLLKEEERVTEQVDKVKKQLEQPEFLSRAPKAYVEKQQSTLKELQIALKDIQTQLKQI